MDLQTVYNQYNEDVIKITKYYGICDYDCDDIKNDFYLKVGNGLLNGKADIIVKNGKLNKPYLFTIVRNLIMDKFKSDNKIDNKHPEDLGLSYDENYDENRLVMMKLAIKDIPDHFDRRLITVFLTEDFTIRGMAKAVGISPTTVFHSLKNSKRFIKHKILKHEQ